MKRTVFATLLLVTITATPSSAYISCDEKIGCHEKQPQQHSVHRGSSKIHVYSGSGVIKSRKTGATATVAAKWAPAFQAYIDDLEAHGAAIYYMGGFRRGHCGLANQHACGAALDVCQDYRGHVSGARDCHLPRPPEMAEIASRHGLFEGGMWCNSDYGHAQAIFSGGACPHRKYATGQWGHGQRRASRHHRRLAIR